MKRMLMFAMAMVMLLAVPFGAQAAEEENAAEMMTLRFPLPAGWQTQEQEEAGTRMIMCMPADGMTKEAIMVMGMDLQDASVAQMTMYVYRMMLSEENTFKQMILQMAGVADSPESAEALAVLESMKISSEETTLDGREAIRIDFSMDVQGEPALGALLITVDGQYNYVLMYLASTEDESGVASFDALLGQAQFISAEQAAA